MPSSLFGSLGSLQRRLILAAAICVSLALAGASASIGFVLHRFVRGQLDGRLDARITALASESRPGPHGELAVPGKRDVPPFDRPRSGWYWEICRGDTVSGSASLDGARLDVPVPGPRPGQDGRPIPVDGVGPFGERLILRLLTVQGKLGEPSTLYAASAPAAALDGPVLEAVRTLGLCLGRSGFCCLPAYCSRFGSGCVRCTG